ncbi:hypothetical protein [Peptoniphilus lacrimalis]|uniref:hypothetical protein n=1 Tax=Peptoniphilus lacrimalis TaxID=33031 RepID=UPI0023FA3CE3|nr:hypothetical protein [Peptoniphilus lacrimalis]
MNNYDANYDPNNLAVNAPDFEEPHVEERHVAHSYQDPRQDEVYRKYYEELKNREDKRLERPNFEIESKNRENLNLSEKKLSEESNNKVFKLLKPFEFEGELIQEVYLDLDSLTGKDIMDASKGVESFMQETNKTYLANIAAIAMKRPKEIMYYMSAKDATAICYFVMDFLID